MALLPDKSVFARLLTVWVLQASRHAKLVLLAAVALTAASLYYTLHHLTINTDTDSMINPNLPFRQEYGLFNRQFPQLADNFVVVVESVAPEAAAAGADALAARLETNGALYKSIFVPGAGDFFEHNGFLFLDTERLERLVDQLAAAQPLLSPLAERPSLDNLLTLQASVLDDIRANNIEPEGLIPVLQDMAAVVEGRAQGTPTVLSWQNIVDRDAEPEGQTAMARRFIFVQPALDFSRLQPARAALDDARKAAAALKVTLPGVDFRFTGKIALNTEELQSVSAGAARAGIISFVLVAVIMLFGVRAKRLVLAALLTLAMGLCWTAGFALFAIGYLNIVSIAFAVLFIGLGIDFAIHFGLRYMEERAGQHGHSSALRTTAATAGKALALGAPTTALGFYAFAPTDYQGLAQLGLISGTGIFISLFASLTIMPALFTLLGVRAPQPLIGVNRAMTFLSRQAGTLLVLGAGLAVVAIFALPATKFDFDPIRLKDPSSPSVQTYLALASEATSSPYSVQILVADDPSTQAIIDRVKALPEVERVVSINSFVPGDQDRKVAILSDAAFFFGDLAAGAEAAPVPDPAAEQAALPPLRAALTAMAGSDNEGLAEASTALESALAHYQTTHSDQGDPTADLREGLVHYLPHMLKRLAAGLAPEVVTRATLPAALAERYIAPDGRLRLEVFPAGDASDQAVLKQFVDAVSGVAPGVTGSAVQVVNAGAVVVQSMRQATIMAIVAIAGFLFAIMRRLSDVVLVILPVALATLLTTAATVWVGVPFNFANVIVLPLIIGLGVTSGIHIVMRARQDSRAADLLETSTPKAVLLSALTTMGSFASLALSSHWGTASMGILLTIGLSFTLITTLILLPALLIVLDHRRNAHLRGQSPSD